MAPRNFEQGCDTNMSKLHKPWTLISNVGISKQTLTRVDRMLCNGEHCSGVRDGCNRKFSAIAKVVVRKMLWSVARSCARCSSEKLCAVLQ